MNRLIRLSRELPAPPPALTLTYTPIRLPTPGRQPLELRLTAPVGTGPLPIVILSHGFGPSNAIPSKDGYAPSPSSGLSAALRSSSPPMPARASAGWIQRCPEALGSGASASPNCARSSTGWTCWSACPA